MAGMRMPGGGGGRCPRRHTRALAAAAAVIVGGGGGVCRASARAAHARERDGRAMNEQMVLARRGIGSLQNLKSSSAERSRENARGRERESEREWLQRQRQRDGGAGAAAGPLRLTVLKITPDGRCMFRALVQGMAQNRVNDVLTQTDEAREADSLRMAVNEALCSGSHRRREYVNAVRGAKVEYGGLDRYCNVSRRPTHWGGEVELLVVSKMLKLPIIVYRPLANGGAFKIMVEYGAEYMKSKEKSVKPVRLLYLGNHYDLLV